MIGFDFPGFLAEIQKRGGPEGDVLFGVGLPPCVMREGEVVRVEVLRSLSPFHTEALVLHLLTSAPGSAAKRVSEAGAAFAYSIPLVNRFRVAVFLQRGTFAITLRSIRDRVPSLEELELPEVVKEAAGERTGSVFVNGPAGSGRTTTLAAFINEINRQRACPVMTVEEPLEFSHKHEAAIHQREVGIDTPFLAQGLANAARAGPEVVLAPEIPGPEKAQSPLELAETAYLVLTSLREVDTASALWRWLSLFPPEERSEASEQLARALRFSFTQRLVPHQDGCRRPVVEVFRHSQKAYDFFIKGELLRAVLAGKRQLVGRWGEEAAARLAG
ncbi:MAG: type IV pilus twitching motility protein PilT [Thermoanaerobaculaceae bacterium]